MGLEKLLLTGLAASPGVGIGPVRIVHNSSELDTLQKGDVLVAETTSPDFIVAMKRVVAIVTDRGGRTCHAAIVCRELGIPCVVGTESATKLLSTGQEVIVDGSQGKVFNGERK